jgi:hypothetical protein
MKEYQWRCPSSQVACIHDADKAATLTLSLTITITPNDDNNFARAGAFIPPPPLKNDANMPQAALLPFLGGGGTGEEPDAPPHKSAADPPTPRDEGGSSAG